MLLLLLLVLCFVHLHFLRDNLVEAAPHPTFSQQVGDALLLLIARLVTFRNLIAARSLPLLVYLLLGLEDVLLDVADFQVSGLLSVTFARAQVLPQLRVHEVDLERRLTAI